ncbi:hypothetical protein RhiirA5_434053 [Rhizophagus irregularis]|uniref:RING-type domain-containing protein n=1 Tax=Rhizophagus irregularis TaxID=588596 RepID=A0A2N0NQQ1_9GLOM|nr:hypothetical protein RhiirA5_434053 [Rhizophagus irregularis]
MENQGSVNPTFTTDYDNMGDLAYDDDNDNNNNDDGEKYLEDDTVKNKEIQELGQCTECTNNILSSPIKALTILTCRHIFHRPCIEKQLLHTKPSTCPFPDYRKNIDIIMDLNSTRRGSQSSQSSRTSALTNLMGKKVVLNSPVIPEEGRPEDSMDMDPDSNVALMMSMLLSSGKQSSFKTTEVAKEIFNQITNPNNSENVNVSISKDSGGQIQHPKCEKCSEEISIEFTKDTVFLSCKHAVHYDYIDDLCKKCPTCPAEDLELFPVKLTSSTVQKKCIQESTAEKSSSKKKKTSNKNDVSSMLKKLIEELLTNIPDSGEVLKEANVLDASSNTGKFLYLSDMIDQAEKKNKDATQNELKSSYGKDRAKALVEEKVRKQIPETKFSNEALRRRRGAEKVYKLFNSIGKTKIERIRSFLARFILNLSDNNVNRVIAEAERR